MSHTRITILSLILAAVLAILVGGNTANSNDYVTYQEGDFPLIISAPHGGYRRPNSIPDRHNGCLQSGQCVYNHHCSPRTSRCRAVTSRDTSTKEIALALSQRVRQLTGGSPHVVINELHRSKMDANREFDLATFSDPEAVQAYGNYTLSIHKARTLIGLLPGGRGLFGDIHGQTHSEEWVELGYRIDRTDLNSGEIPVDTSSIRALIERNCGSEVSCAELLISGRQSLGHFLQAGGYRVVPSPGITSPGNGNYFRGGFNTETYGSRCGEIDAIQVEIPRSIRFGDWETFADSLGDAIVNFMALHEY